MCLQIIIIKLQCYLNYLSCTTVHQEKCCKVYIPLTKGYSLKNTFFSYTEGLTWWLLSPAICHSLSDPPNGTVVAEGNCEGDRAAFVCNSGFELVGAAILTCQNDGMWNNPQPVCQSLAGI